MQRRGFSHIIFLCLLVCLQQVATAQLPDIKTSINKNRILIGEQIDYSVQVTMPDNRYRLTWLKVPEPFGAFVVASQDKIDTSYTTGTLNYLQHLLITSFDSGRQVIPPLSFEFETLSGDSLFKMMTDSIAIDVLYSPDDSVLPFHDIKPILSVKKERPWWLWPAIITGILLLALIIYLIIKKRRKNRAGKIFHSDLSDYDEAMKLLGDLKMEQLPDKGEFKQYYLRLSDIFKRYISRQTNTNKMYLTGDELIAQFSEMDTDKDLLREVASAIKVGDAVKFAKYKPAVRRSEEDLDFIERAIRKIHAKEEQQKEEGKS